ncbi:hypothetical protein UFOVP566_30 [uncultured Caudovirales phage]|uniref:Uncharacterized protein n=1 Tax=uncultured Caudovirales phage TaxID=2100421 RepID=A0A6J5MZE3_9CAUD|nr:hypothetical protein UFOVP294_55 [uncultured Caudovirales phage]CAB4150390.1 hypothetical protein UFOVP566_30 [uncultured Caudovirales phage]
MRWFFLLLMLVTISAAQDKLILSNGPLPKKQEKPKQVNCAIQELYAISWTMHDPAERHKAMLDWLDKSKCSPEDYVIIWNALPEWAGTSDSPMLRAKIMEKAK